MKSAMNGRRAQKAAASFAACLAVFGAASSAAAKPSPRNLWPEADRQARWPRVKLEVPGVEGVVTAYVTDGKELRLDRFDGPMRSAATLDSSIFGLFKTKESFAANCHMIVPAIEQFRKKQNRFTAEIAAIPLSGAFYSVAYEDGRRETLRGPLNAPERANWFKASVFPSPGAVVLKTGLDLEAVEAGFVGQLEKQAESILKTGKIALDLTALDDLACDLLAGRATLEVTVNSHYPKALLSRAPLFQADEIEKLHEGAKRMASQWEEQDGDAKVLTPFYLGASLTAISRDASELAPWEIDRLIGFLSDPGTRKVATLERSAFRGIAERMARLAQESAFSSPAYRADFRSQAQPNSQPNSRADSSSAAVSDARSESSR